MHGFDTVKTSRSAKSHGQKRGPFPECYDNKHNDRIQSKLFRLLVLCGKLYDSGHKHTCDVACACVSADHVTCVLVQKVIQVAWMGLRVHGLQHVLKTRIAIENSERTSSYCAGKQI